MSANLDLVRSICADFERGDYSRADWAHPDIEFVVADGPEPGSWRGRMELARAWRDFLSAWEHYRGAVDGYREIDDDRVLALVRRTGRAKASGIDLAQMQNQSATIFEIHHGKVTRLVIYLDRDRALADLGLEEEPVAEESTTPDLAERMKRAVEAFNAGDFDLSAGFYAPDALFYPRAAVGVLEGREAIRSFIEDWHGMYEAFTFELKECRDLGNGVTFSVISQRGRLADTTAWVPEERSALVCTWMDGLIEKETNFTDIDEARAAAERLAQERG